MPGPWLAETLKGLRSPDGLARIEPGPALQATLRPYQQAGVRWLYLLHRLGLGACLADDMGLGKTIQVLSLLLILKHESTVQRTATPTRAPSLLVAPASLLANWAAEIERFAPTLRFLIAHPSASSAADLKAMTSETLAEVDLVITSYGALLRYDWLSSTAVAGRGHRRGAGHQESGRQADARRQETHRPHSDRAHRHTGGESSGDLWSIFDFTHPGLLGSGQAFGRYVRRLAEAKTYRPLRELVRPYILRRLKTDKSVIADLPDKTEMKAFCYLSATQAALYQRAVEELAEALDRRRAWGAKALYCRS